MNALVSPWLPSAAGQGTAALTAETLSHAPSAGEGCDTQSLDAGLLMCLVAKIPSHEEAADV